jgi:hypothetical protein
MAVQNIRNIPLVRIPVNRQPEQVQPDIYVTGGTVQGCMPYPLQAVLEPQVTFYAQVPIRIKCQQDGCDGHIKYGVWEDRNLPVVFSHHKYEVAHYYAFVIKATLPFRIPDRGNELIDGIKWYSSTPRDGQVGLSNTCMLDGHLMDFKLRTLDMTHCTGCIFMHKAGRGRMIERILRTMMHYIFMVANPQPDRDGMYQACRAFTYEQQLFVKRIWIDKIYQPGELDLEIEEDLHGGRHIVHDLLRDPVTGQQMLTRLSMYRMVLENMFSVSHYNIDTRCQCGDIFNRPMQILRFRVADTQEGRHLFLEPAYNNFNPMTLEFDRDYWETSEGETRNTSDELKTMSRKVHHRDCSRCGTKLKVTGMRMPEESWFAICEVPAFMKNSLTLRQLPIAAIITDQAFEISWVSMMATNTHFVSAHFLNGHWYYYNDIKGLRASEPCPVRIIDLDRFDYAAYDMQRVFYRRTTETNPHRCIQKAYEEEVIKID